MCANYRQLNLFDFPEDFRAPPPEFGYPEEAWPGYDAPIIMRDEKGGRVPARAIFGMVPHWAETKLARQTYNARSETVGGKPSFRNAWKRHQFCLVPVASFYEPNYESGKPIRWSIGRKDEKPFALAGIWETKPNGDLPPIRSFSMLTINATGHPLMQRFHGPNDEKRSVVILDSDDYDTWLDCKTDAEARELLRPFDAEMMTAVPAPRPPRAKKDLSPQT